jgi:transcription initiation factor TFIIA large subunit
MDGQNSVAASRAQQQLQAQYGNRAAGSISAIQDRMGQQAQPQVQPGQPPVQQQAYRPPQPNQVNQQQQPPAPGQAFRNGQTDGAGDMDSEDDDDDFEGILLQQTAGGDMQELGRVDIDRIMHKRMAANAKSMEAGGLMLTLKEATKDQPRLDHPASGKRKGKGVAAYDGGDDDEEEDEDAINSDLDDPDEDRDDDEVDDEGLGHIMLCMYDKVQRVKNKWFVHFIWSMCLPQHVLISHIGSVPSKTESSLSMARNMCSTKQRASMNGKFVIWQARISTLGNWFSSRVTRRWRYELNSQQPLAPYGLLLHKASNLGGLLSTSDCTRGNELVGRTTGVKLSRMYNPL